MAGSHSSIDVYTINISALFRVLLLWLPPSFFATFITLVYTE
jgi:hypothetical protein